MKTFERTALVTTGVAIVAAATYLTRKVLRGRIERLCRAAAGESRYERKHTQMYRSSHA